MPRRFAAALLAVVLLCTGCATTLSALDKTPGRVADAFQDPLRRRHIYTQVGLEGSTALVSAGCALLIPFPINLVCIVVGVAYNYLTYEFVLEPIARQQMRGGKLPITGPYWERGPYFDEGQVFERP